MMSSVASDEDLIVYAFRYALGRRAYIVEPIIERILKEWDNLIDSTKRSIVREIEEAFMRGHISYMSFRPWVKILDKYEEDKASMTTQL